MKYTDNTKPNTTNETDFVCIEDFCGRDSTGFPVQYWADWSKKTGFVYFGGDWSLVPYLRSEKRPNDTTVKQWANYHLDMM
jgi:hypothetical protein